MNSPAISSKYHKVIEFVRAAGDEALASIADAAVVKTKDAGRDVTTNLDQKIEKEFYELCKAEFPEDGFVGEEFSDLVIAGVSGYTWQIDPIDGTKFYAKGIPLWTVSVALTKGGESVFGIIYNPTSKHMYVAEEGKGSYLNDQRLTMAQDLQIDSTQLAIDFFIPQNDAAKKAEQDRLLAVLFNDFYRVRGIGLGSLSLAWVAHGLFSAYLGWGLTPDKFVDVAAGLIIAQEAGAKSIMVPLPYKDEVASIVAAPQIADYLAELVLIKAA